MSAKAQDDARCSEDASKKDAVKAPLLCTHCGLACASRNALFRHLGQGCDPDVARAKKPEKVRLALAISYLGTSYHGCVGNEKDEELYPTVEGRVLKAVRKAWGEDVVLGVARCTRTERSVHAAANVLVLTVRGDREHPENALRKELEGTEISLLAPIKPAPGVFDKVYAPKKRVYSYYVPYSALLTKKELDIWHNKSKSLNLDDGRSAEIWVAPLVGVSKEAVQGLCAAQGLPVELDQIEVPTGKTEARLTLSKPVADEACKKLDGLTFGGNVLFALPADEAFDKFAVQRRMRQGVKTLRGPLKGLRSFHIFIPETKRGDPMAMRQLQHCAAGSAFTDIRPGRGLRPTWPHEDWAILTFSAGDFGPQQLRRMCGALVAACRGSETPDYLDRCFAGQTRAAATPDPQQKIGKKVPAPSSSKVQGALSGEASPSTKPSADDLEKTACPGSNPRDCLEKEERSSGHEKTTEMAEEATKKNEDDEASDDSEEEEEEKQEAEKQRTEEGEEDHESADAILLTEQKSGGFEEDEKGEEERQNNKNNKDHKDKDESKDKDDNNKDENKHKAGEDRAQIQELENAKGAGDVQQQQQQQQQQQHQQQQKQQHQQQQQQQKQPPAAEAGDEEEDFDLAPAAPAETLSLDMIDYGHRAGDWLGPMDVKGKALSTARRQIEAKIVEMGHEPWSVFLAQLDAGATRARLHQSLFDAALGGDERLVGEALRRGAWPNALNDYNETPLLAAALAGSEAVVRRLLDARADARHQSNGGATALAVARARQYSNLVELLLQQDREEEQRDERQREGQGATSPRQEKKQEEQGATSPHEEKQKKEKGGALPLDDGAVQHLAAARVTEILPLTANHAGAGSVVVDGAFSEGFLSALEDLWRGLPLAPKDKFSTNERSYYHDIGGWITGPLDRAIGLGGLPAASYATPLMRFLWYPQVGGSLPAHVDLSRKGEDGVRSTYTFIIYLGDCGQGGETNLLECLPGDPALAASGGVAAGTRKVLHSVKPKRGRLLLFPHVCPHSAAPVLCPNKVLLRGEVFPPAKPTS